MPDYFISIPVLYRKDLFQSVGLGEPKTWEDLRTAGKLLEKVAPTWPDSPAPADVLASLRALRGETLGGLMPAMTFRPGRKAGHECGTVMRVENGQFALLGGRNEYQCAPGYQPG